MKKTQKPFRSRHLWLPLLTFFSLCFYACQQADGDWEETVAPKMVELRISVDNGAATRAAFDDNTPVTIYVFTRADATTQNLTATPTHIAEGITVSGVENKLGVAITKVDGSVANTLKVASDQTYDVVVLVNQPTDATLAKGVLSTIPNGIDLMAGRADGVTAESETSVVDVTLNQGGARNNVLPHLCSAIKVEATADQALIDSYAAEGGMKMSIASVILSGIYCQASLGFSGEEMALAPMEPVENGTEGEKPVTAYTFTNNAEPVLITSLTDKVVYNNGILLPQPLKAGDADGKNEVDITIILNINNTSKKVIAHGVKVPAFTSGKRYTFTLNLETLQLLLTVSPWNEVTWNSGMGAETEARLLILELESWEVNTWENHMGGTNSDGTNNK